MLTEDVQSILQRSIRPDDPDAGDAVALIAELAVTSTRTVYRVLSGQSEAIDLDLADRLVLAAGGHLSDCHLVTSTGEVVPYTS